MTRATWEKHHESQLQTFYLQQPRKLENTTHEFRKSDPQKVETFIITT